MHELFLSSVIKEDEVPKILALIGGFTEMRERHQFTRVQHFEPSPAVKGLATIKDLQKERNISVPHWTELHQILVKQPCTIQLRTRITDSEMDTAKKGEAVTIPHDRHRLLRWTELPDPPSQRLPPYITQRKTVEIIDTRLEKILAENKFTRVSNIFDESYHWWQADYTEFALTRTWIAEDSLPADKVMNLAVQEPYAPYWMLNVRTLVESSPERMQQAQTQLEKVRDQFRDVLDFKVFDRRAMDTRILPVNGSVV
ncbi:mediator complex, subunit Med18 [Triangularia verruculosa]|uniref:Mediator of RNA polymerase II transcription subunit 18 n=1 Tax=Triangularia verruculosa TaxID=2587418 RepID=A0AAN6X6Z4_9PEZI|nr:mediator complex, subunit Med18 [Triangularia verruculosa]